MLTKDKVFLNEKYAKKLFKNEKYGKVLSAKVISNIIGADFQEVFDNIQLSSEEIAFSALTLESSADIIYHDDATYFDIELNFYNSKTKSKQLESYVYQLYLGQLYTYHNYKSIKRVVQISIDAYDYFHKNEFMYKVLLMETKYHIPYNDLIQIIHLNLDYLSDMDYNDVVKTDNQLMKTLYFLVCNDDKILNIVYERDDFMKDLIKEAKKMAGIEKMNLYLSDDEMIQQDEEILIEKGREEEKREIAKNMLQKGMSIDDIVEITTLSKEKIKELSKELN